MSYSPEQQARHDWREEAAFHPEQFTSTERARYMSEARRIEFENEEAA